MATTESSASAHPNPRDGIADRIEAEIARLRKNRPHLEERLNRASSILVTHLALTQQRVIRVRIQLSGHARFLVNGSKGAVYVVDPDQGWSCSCPDHHRRGGGICKHGIACYILRRAVLPARRLRSCDGCDGRFPRRELVELTEEKHDNLKYHHGDLLCGACADRSGVSR